MKKSTAFRICNRGLLCLTVVILLSGLQLEINPYGDRLWVWIHIAVGLLFMAGIVWHLRLHRWPHAGRRPVRGKKHPALGIFFLLTLISGVVAMVHWMTTFVHSTIGGIHGKLGFLMIIAVVVHVSKHFKFYKNN